MLALVAGGRTAEKPKAAKGKLTSIQGIAEATEKKLREAGVASVDELLEKGGTPKGREDADEEGDLLTDSGSSFFRPALRSGPAAVVNAVFVAEHPTAR